MDLTYSPLVISKRPHFFNGTLVFGSGTELGVPQNASKVTMSARAGVSFLLFFFVENILFLAYFVRVL